MAGQACSDGELSDLKGDALLAAKLWPGKVEAISLECIKDARLIIDALFGAGLAREIAGPLAEVVDAVSNAGVPVISVDIPTGIDGETGQVLGTAVPADLTVTFFRRKPGHLLLPGRTFCGELVCAQIGIPDSALPQGQQIAMANDPGLWLHYFAGQKVGLHKYDHGHALVISGDACKSGAARLAANAALRAGAGLLTVAAPKNAMATNAAHLTAIMLTEADDAKSIGRILTDRRKNAVCIGPGAGISSSARAKVRAVLTSGASIVLDADALTNFSSDPDVLFSMIKEHPKRAVVLTPHEGEFRRLFSCLSESSDSKYQRALAAAQLSGAVVVLKGADTVVAEPGGRTIINDNAPPRLATAGAGDVLAGIILANLARQIPPFEAAAAAVWLHGAAAQAGMNGMTADDLTELLPVAIAALDK